MTDDLRKSLRALSLPGAAVPDGELLARFVSSRDEFAFEALVRRHGPMVLGTCRRVLRHAHDAEDAFQATFLMLARKASAVVKRDSVGGWLYRVAYHVALAAKGASDRRRVRERQGEVPHPEVPLQEPQDWLPLLHRELARLPDKYREVVVLCDLEGLPRREVACRLGVPEGTLSSRLVFARRKLAARLSRLGVGLPAGALVVALSEASVSAALVSSTVRGATLLMAGEAAVVGPAVALMKGALQQMLIQKLKVVVATAVILLTLGIGGFAYRAGGQTAPAEKPRLKKPLTELEALRRENQLLKLNLEVVLEKVARLEAEMRGLRGPVKELGDPKRDLDKGRGAPKRYTDKAPPDDPKGFRRNLLDKGQQPKDEEFFKRFPTKDRVDPKRNLDKGQPPKDAGNFKRYQPKDKGDYDLPKSERNFRDKGQGDPLTQAEEALKALRAAPDAEAQRKAADALERALRALRGKRKPADGYYYIPDKKKP